MKISTSILNSNNRIDSVLKLNRTNTSYIHVDVMDGKFVRDTQFNINEINGINRVTKYPMDVHLMVNDPIAYIVKLKNMNIKYITFHLEIRRSKEKIISKIKECGYKVGISIKPDTDIEKLKPYLKDIDLVLVMSVEPGKGGQEFLETTVNRVNELRKIIDDNNYNIQIEVDGGINDKTITKLSGVDIAVVGSYIIKSDNYYESIERLLKKSFNSNEKRLGVKELNFCLILFILGMIPYLYMIYLAIYNSINGYSGKCIKCFGDDYYGIKAFLDTIRFIFVDMLPYLFLGLLLISFSFIKMLNYKMKIKKL